MTPPPSPRGVYPQPPRRWWGTWWHWLCLAACIDQQNNNNPEESEEFPGQQQHQSESTTINNPSSTQDLIQTQHHHKKQQLKHLQQQHLLQGTSSSSISSITSKTATTTAVPLGSQSKTTSRDSVVDHQSYCTDNEISSGVNREVINSPSKIQIDNINSGVNQTQQKIYHQYQHHNIKSSVTDRGDVGDCIFTQDEKERLRMAVSEMSSPGHCFAKKTFHKPVYCHHCTDLLWGIIGQGYTCEGAFLIINIIHYIHGLDNIQHLTLIS